VSRDWGPWTIIKLDALEKYYSAFTTASKSAKRTLYLDLFGGEPENRERATERVFPGSALRAAMATPPFTKLLVSELDEQAAKKQRDALTRIVGDRAEVLPGDCNVVIPAAMRSLDRRFRWAPTFALLDQYSAEISWETVKFLATYKDAAAPTKIELCVFFSGSFIVRGLRGPHGQVNAGYAARVDALFGNHIWRELQAARDDGVLTGGQLNFELVNLMRSQLQAELGYATTIPLEVLNTAGRGIFHLIFATDHPVGDRIMRTLFEGAEDALELMGQNQKIAKKIERDAAIGQDSLFPVEPMASVSPRTARNPVLPPAEPFRYHRMWTEDRQS
jgi:three-Cys-motif partner protein